jgi:glycosyltransferase involved in cell wall biosynthesis
MMTAAGRCHEGKALKKILLVANTGWYLYNFRLPLARLLRSQGVEPVLVSPRDAYVARLESEGFRCVEFALNRRSRNPLRELLVVADLIRIYRAERPGAVHHFTIKCVLYGTLAAKLTGIRAVVNAVTGLGPVFLGTDWKARALRPLLKWFYRNVLTARRVRVVFQNQDDLQTFTNLHLVIPDRTIIIRGSGVDLQRFSPRPSHPDEPPTPIVLFASRLMREKGIGEFVEAVRLLKRRQVKAVFQVAGSPDPGNHSSLSPEDLKSWQEEGLVDLLGHVDEVDDLIAHASLVVLPSYREGTPRILLEAAAMGKPIVATDVPGCREAVVHGENGLLVPVRDAPALADAIETLLKDSALRAKMGENGRRKMVREFDCEDVAWRTGQVYIKLGALPAWEKEPQACAA